MRLLSRTSSSWNRKSPNKIVSRRYSPYTTDSLRCVSRRAYSSTHISWRDSCDSLNAALHSQRLCRGLPSLSRKQIPTLPTWRRVWWRVNTSRVNSREENSRSSRAKTKSNKSSRSRATTTPSVVSPRHSRRTPKNFWRYYINCKSYICIYRLSNQHNYLIGLVTRLDFEGQHSGMFNNQY